MKKINSLLLAALAAVAFTACSEDGEGTEEPTTNNEVKSGLITADETWKANTIYELAGRVVVSAGATLTIEPGTIIKGRTGNGSLASALVIARGAKINAAGTADKPIIFTSVLDDITVGSKFGTTLEKEDNQKWGGLIILGAAPISAENGDDESSIEGIPADEEYGLYGGTNVSDNSGVLNYISVRHGGALIGEGNEINGITLGGVGNGTTMTNIEVFGTLDDGIEFFGGSVNVTNLMIAWQGDDGVDIDQNYSGTVDNFAVIHGAGVGTDEGLEIDGPEGTLSTGLFTLVNGSVMSDGSGSAADLKSKAQGTIDNVKFSGYGADKFLKVRYSYSSACTGIKTDAYTNLVTDNKLKVLNSEFSSVTVYTASVDANDVTCPLDAAFQTAASAAVTSTTATGANMSEFDWTLAKQVGLY